ncbi:MAG: hypothetical protein HPY76_14950, partial [Anaerolineae bacterium]|nr:hypothetical protein [Anaerolineae bacterium]
MQSRDLYDAIRTSFPVEVQPQVISALRQDSMVWEAVNDQILLNRLVAIPDALLAKWNPATIALVAIDQFPLIKILSEGYETPLSEDLLNNSSVVYQRLTSPLSKPKNIVDAAYVSLWLREKRRSSG